MTVYPFTILYLEVLLVRILCQHNLPQCRKGFVLQVALDEGLEISKFSLHSSNVTAIPKITRKILTNNLAESVTLDGR